MLGLKIYGSGIRGLCVSWWVYEPLRGVLQGFIVSCWILQVFFTRLYEVLPGSAGFAGFYEVRFCGFVDGFHRALEGFPELYGVSQVRFRYCGSVHGLRFRV